MTAYGWDELRGLSLARQFPEVPGRDAAAVAAVLRRVGPIQSQTARSPYVGLGARLPGVVHEAVSEAYETWAIVRGSTIRGTVHTCAAVHHRLLDAATRIGNRALWQRTLRLERHDLEQVWAAIEEFARDAWRTPAELLAFLTGWLAERGEHESARRLDDQEGRFFGFGHGGLLRRPLSGGWSGQGAPGYRTAAALLPEAEAAGDPLLDVVRLHLAAYGPSSRQDVAWWSGLGLRRVDDLLDRLDVTRRTGPGGRTYADLPDAPAARDLPGVRLLPEFDALLCGYDPKARDRFVSPADNERLWSRANGLMVAPVLVDGRLGGAWRIERSGRARTLAVHSFPGSRRLRRAEVGEAADLLAVALGVAFASVSRD